MTATAHRPSFRPVIETERNSLRLAQLREVATLIPSASAAAVVDAGRHAKVSFTLPVPLGYAPIDVVLGERLLVVGGTRLPAADFADQAPAATARVVLDQALWHLCTEQLRTHFSGYRSAAGPAISSGMLWIRSVEPTWDGSTVAVTLVDPTDGRHLHLALTGEGIAVRLDSATRGEALGAAAARTHLERIAEAYGRTHGELTADLRRFATFVLTHPVVAAAATVTATR